MHIAKLYNACEQSWDEHTSYNTDYGDTVRLTAPDRAYGQCAVTSLVLHDRFGGNFIQADVSWHGSSVVHYWLDSPDVGELDFTWQQFPSYASRTNVRRVTRNQLLPRRNRWMRDRYELLARRVAVLIPIEFAIALDEDIDVALAG